MRTGEITLERVQLKDITPVIPAGKVHRSQTLTMGARLKRASWYILDPPCPSCGGRYIFQVLSSGREDFLCEGFHLILRLPEGARP